MEITNAESGKYSVTNSDAVLKIANWKNFEIDFSKVETLADVINVLRGLGIIISLDASDPHPRFAPIMPYLKVPSSSGGDEGLPK